MPLTLLTDTQIEGLLKSLSRDEAFQFLEAFELEMHGYSSRNRETAENGDTGNPLQPPRISIKNPATQATSLFMPTGSDSGLGVKVVTLSPSNPRPTGATTLFSPLGTPVAFLHAQTLTGFRTALGSNALLIPRRRVGTITVFGAGEQAYWHVRLALLFRGPDIKVVNVVCVRPGSAGKGAGMVRRLLEAADTEMREAEGWDGVKFDVMGPGQPEEADFATEVKKRVAAADVIFTCTPSTESLFAASFLEGGGEDGARNRLIAAIGSYEPHMRELPPELFQGKDHAVVVDTRNGVLEEAGEIIAARMDGKQLVELGDLVPLLSGFRSRSSDADPTSTEISRTCTPADIKLALAQDGASNKVMNWLREGDIIYKSVGVGTMDLAASFKTVELAKIKGFGTQVDGF